MLRCENIENIIYYIYAIFVSGLCEKAESTEEHVIIQGKQIVIGNLIEILHIYSAGLIKLNCECESESYTFLSQRSTTCSERLTTATYRTVWRLTIISRECD